MLVQWLVNERLWTNKNRLLGIQWSFDVEWAVLEYQMNGFFITKQEVEGFNDSQFYLFGGSIVDAEVWSSFDSLMGFDIDFNCEGLGWFSIGIAWN